MRVCVCALVCVRNKVTIGDEQPSSLPVLSLIVDWIHGSYAIVTCRMLLKSFQAMTTRVTLLTQNLSCWKCTLPPTWAVQGDCERVYVKSVGQLLCASLGWRSETPKRSCDVTRMQDVQSCIRMTSHERYGVLNHRQEPIYTSNKDDMLLALCIKNSSCFFLRLPFDYSAPSHY